MRAISFTEDWEEIQGPSGPPQGPAPRVPSGVTSLQVNLANIRRYLTALEAHRPGTLPTSSSFKVSVTSRNFNIVINKFGNRKRRHDLCRLSLRGYKNITDQSLEYLAHLKLELLDLTYTSVTKAGIESFLNLNPDCRIIHPLYCTCKPRSPF